MTAFKTGQKVVLDLSKTYEEHGFLMHKTRDGRNSFRVYPFEVEQHGRYGFVKSSNGNNSIVPELSNSAIRNEILKPFEDTFEVGDNVLVVDELPGGYLAERSEEKALGQAGRITFRYPADTPRVGGRYVVRIGTTDYILPYELIAPRKGTVTQAVAQNTPVFRPVTNPSVTIEHAILVEPEIHDIKYYIANRDKVPSGYTINYGLQKLCKISDMPGVISEAEIGARLQNIELLLHELMNRPEKP